MIELNSQGEGMKSLAAIAVVAVIAVFGAIGFAHSGLYDVSARSQHSGFVNWLLTATSRASVARRAGNIDVPDLMHMIVNPIVPPRVITVSRQSTSTRNRPIGTG
jgi:hypothetical protein